MSTTIDERVVGMRFDNKQFESNVATTMSTLDKLKQKLNLQGASKGLEDVGSAAKGINLMSLGGAVETVQAKFSSLGVVGVTALANITNQAVNTGKRIVSALTIDPIKTGLSEYETQINAVQTIMANTQSKGTTLDQVNGALDELNTYADKTIYNFTEMTRNIGTFTAAGVDLDTSVKSIQGIANLAAVSGSTSTQASTAMYQLSQALAAGKVSLMDWNSVVNAGMGGQVFQDALKRTATVMGTDVDALIKKYGSFRESLTQGEWLTSDVLTKTLEQFTMSAKEGTKEWENYKKSLMDDGYTETQAEEILKMANTATEAATKVKTFSQLWDTLKETAQSGWSQTWEIILGDFEEAKSLFTELYEMLSPIIEASSKARIELLEGWAKAGGRDDLLQSFRNVFEGISSIVKPIKDAFREIFPPVTVKQLTAFTEGLMKLTEKLKLSDTTSKNLKRTFKGVFAILDIVRQGFVAVFKALSPLFGGIGDLGGGILEFTANLGDSIVEFNEFLKSSGIFEKATEKIKSALTKVVDFLKSVGRGIDTVTEAISSKFSKVADNVDGRLEPLKTLGDFLMSVFSGIGEILGKVLPYAISAAKGIGTAISNLLGGITSSIQNADYTSLFDFVNGGIISAIGIFIAKFVKSGGDILDNAGGFLENINGILEGVSDAFGAFTESMKAETLKKIAIAIGILAASLLVLSLIDSDKLTLSLVAVSTLFAELMGSMAIFTKILDGKKLKGLGKTTLALMGLSAALLILSAALKIMSTMSWQEMGVGLISLTVGLGALVGAVNLLPESKVNGAARAIKKMSTAILILSVALKIMSTMSWKEMGVGLISMTVGLAALVAAVNLLPKDAALRSAGMLGLASAMVVLAAALKIMATMSWEEIGKSLVALAGSLAILAGAMFLMKTAVPGALAMLIIAPALIVLSTALTMMSSLSWDEIARGLTALAGSLLLIAGATALMKTALPGALAMLIMAPAIVTFAVAIRMLAALSWEEVARGLVTLAGAFTVIGLAALILKPLIPTILSLSASFALFGLACAAIGVGVLAVGAGLTALAAALTASGGAIVVFVSSIISLIPYLIEQIGVGLIKLCEVIAGSSKAICDAVTVIILAVVDALVISVPYLVEGALVLVDELLKALVEYTPTIVSALFDFLIGVIDTVAERMPDLIQAGVNLVMALLSGVLDSLKTIDPEILVKGLLAVGFMAALMAALASIAMFTPAAMAGVLGFGLVITELSLVLAAIGALAQIPGLEWLINEGGQFLQTVGTAIGKFVGGIVGGFASGVSAQLPQIGTDLSAFMTNIQPFIDGAKSIDQSVITGVGVLSGALLALTAAELMNGITSFLTGGATFAQLGTDLSSFMSNAQGFITGVASVDPNILNGVKALAQAILILTAAELVQGITSFVLGEGSLASFGAQLSELGIYLNDFVTNLGSFDETKVTAVTCAAKAIKAMAMAASEIPNEGGWLAKIVGDNNIAVFGAYLPQLGTNLSEFATNLGAFDETKINTISCAANAIKAMATAAGEIPNEGGWLAKIVGDNSIATFGGYLPQLGTHLKEFAANLGTFDDAKVTTITCAANAVKTMAAAASEIPNEGGWLGAIVGGNSIETFGGFLPQLGTHLSEFATNLGTFDEAKVATVTCAANAIKTMASAAEGLPNEGGWLSKIVGDNSIATFGGYLPGLGTNLKGFADNLGTFDESKVTTVNSAVNAINAFGKLADTDLSDATKNISDFGKKLVGFGEKMNEFCTEITKIDTSSIDTAVSNMKKLVSVAQSIASVDSKAVGNFANSLKKLGKTGVDKFIDTFKDAEADVEKATKKMMGKAVDGIESKEDSIKKAGTSAAGKAVDGAETQDDDMESAGKDLGSGLVRGIKAKETAAYNAGYALGQKAVQGEKDGQKSKSPSKLTILAGKWLGEGLVIGMEKMGDSVYRSGSDLGRTATQSLSNAVSRMADLVSTDIDTQPVIRPVLDLSDVESGAGTIGSLFGFGPSVGVLANVGAINASMNGHSQNGNDDVVSAITKLRKDLGNMDRASYNINGITYDDGSAVSEAIKVLVREVKVGRRV